MQLLPIPYTPVNIEGQGLGKIGGIDVGIPWQIPRQSRLKLAVSPYITRSASILGLAIPIAIEEAFFSPLEKIAVGNGSVHALDLYLNQQLIYTAPIETFALVPPTHATRTGEQLIIQTYVGGVYTSIQNPPQSTVPLELELGAHGILVPGQEGWETASISFFAFNAEMIMPSNHGPYEPQAGQGSLLYEESAA